MIYRTLRGLIVAGLLGSFVAPALAQSDANARPRVIVLTDIGNEPDDDQSLIRFLLYGTDYDIEGIFATTSQHLKNRVEPERIYERIDAYQAVYANLKIHAPTFPEPAVLRARVSTCQSGFGMAAVGEDWDSEGARRIIEAVDGDDSRPLWVVAWGGTNCLAQVLWRIAEERPAAAVDAFVQKLRVYAISDQDDAGPWLRRTFPNLFYIVSPGSRLADYANSTWRGISGDHAWTGTSRWGEVFCFMRQRWGGSCGEPEGGPDFNLVDNPWLDAHIRRGPLGALYPRTLYIMEGDSPSFMNLIDNGLNAHRSPAWGGWGGRYALHRPLGEPREIWTNDADRVIDSNGATHATNQATIWRWRAAYQRDFAARMAWTLASAFDGANHPPAIMVDGDASSGPVHRKIAPGEAVDIPVIASDPDADEVTLSAWQYREAGTAPAVVEIRWIGPGLRLSVPEGVPRGTAHVIVEAVDGGTPAMTRYRRLLLTIP